MLKRSILRSARRVNGQTAWSPNTGGAMNSSSSGTMSSNEALAMTYRPLPLRDTVDYEEDIGNSIMLHRECIPRKIRSSLGVFHDVPLAYSDTELRDGRRQIANVMNSSAAGMRYNEQEAIKKEGYAASDRIRNIDKHATFDPATETLESVQFLFTEKRLQYCRRFVRGLRHLFDPVGAATRSAVDMDDPHAALETTTLHGLMEVAAILYSASAEESEDYLAQFGLARDVLEALCAAQRSATETALGTIEAYNAAMKMRELQEGGGSASAGEEKGALLQREGGSAAEGGSSDAAPAVTITADNVDFATTYAAYIDFASGKTATPVPSPTLGLSSVSGTTPPPAVADVGLGVADRHLLSSKLRWRSLLDTIVAEDFHRITAADMEALQQFSDYLHTFKFMEYKVGDCVRQIIQSKHHDFGASRAHDPDGSLGATSRPSNPLNRGLGAVSTQ